MLVCGFIAICVHEYQLLITVNGLSAITLVTMIL